MFFFHAARSARIDDLSHLNTATRRPTRGPGSFTIRLAHAGDASQDAAPCRFIRYERLVEESLSGLHTRERTFEENKPGMYQRGMAHIPLNDLRGDRKSIKRGLCNNVRPRITLVSSMVDLHAAGLRERMAGAGLAGACA